MIVYDFECFKYDWLIVWLDTDTRKFSYIVNDKKKFELMYTKYKNDIWVGYNSRNYDQWIAKAILCDFNPWMMNEWIITKERKGYEFSKLLNKFPIMNYDCLVGSGYSAKGLKELEAYMGHDIRETSVPFDISRKLTQNEINMTLKYCKHDVQETFEVFVETKEEFESVVGLILEFDLPMSYISKTKAQISAVILGAVKQKHNDEFKISFPDTLKLGQYEWIKDWYLDWAKTETYDGMELNTTIGGIPHTLGIGGLHGSIDNYIGDGYYIMADVGSYYPAIMIEYNFLSRNVMNPHLFTQIRDERIVLKRKKDKRQLPRKIVLNATYGASKDQYNSLYDPLQANNVCIAGQLLLIDLIDKLEGKCQLIQSNTDGILIKLYDRNDEAKITAICDEWCKRTRMELEFDKYRRVIQKDVNNYIIVPEGELYDEKGKPLWKAKGGFVKSLSRLDNDLPIVNKAVKDYFIFNISPEKTIMQSNNLIDFQKVTKISKKYGHGFHNNKILSERVHRCFASTRHSDGTLYKKNISTGNYDKTASTPESCFILNDDIQETIIPTYLDKQWYIDMAYYRIDKFTKGN